MKNTKLLSLLVAIATISPVLAYQYCWEDEDGKEHCEYRDRTVGKRDVVTGTGRFVGRTGRAAGNAAREVVEAPANIVGGFFGAGRDRDYYND